MLTKQEFEEAYQKFPPCKCELFFLKYLSVHSLYDNRWLAVVISILLVFPFLLWVLFNSMDLSLAVKFIPSCIYILMLTMFGTYWLLIWFKKKIRLEKVRKHLGISKEEYQELIIAYYYHRYPSVKAFISHNSKIKK